ncbi:MAG TPA: hypothetical protein VGS79_12425 [Puia sp.]|nr:hypothetical protein [Puia sp.]
MGILTYIGRIFYGLAMAATGLLTIYYRDFPYYFIPPRHVWLTDHVIVIYLCGALLFVAGAWIVWGRKLMPVSLLLGAVLLLIFCLYFIPYELSTPTIYMHFGAWENSAKELALAGGALVVGGRKLGCLLFALTIISFGVDHYLYAHEATAYMPSWVGYKLFWLYFTGTCLLGSGLAILLRIRVRLFASLLGTMIFIWVIIVHIPKATAAPIAVNGGEIVSGLIALAYCGIALMIAGGYRKTGALDK